MPASFTQRSKCHFKATLCRRSTLPRATERVRVVLARAEKQPVVILPGLGNSCADYDKLSELLQGRYSCDVEVAPVARLDWGRNAAGLTDVRYWQGSLPPRPTVDWYLDSISTAVNALKERGHSRPLAMLTHSAGGWLGRVFMHGFGSEGIDRFVSLGSPHMPPPKDIPGAMDQTRGILQYCDDTFPGCHEEGVTYVTVAGKFLEGVKWGDEGSLQQRIAGQGYKQVREEYVLVSYRLRTRHTSESFVRVYAYASRAIVRKVPNNSPQVCGNAAVWGDGIVPVPAAHLPGATQVELDGVYHSPLGAAEGRYWYGDEEHIEKWIDHLVEP